MPETNEHHVPQPQVARLIELIALDPRSDTAIAKAAGLNRQHLHQIKAGVRRSPSLGTAGAILKALGRKFADLDEDAE